MKLPLKIFRNVFLFLFIPLTAITQPRCSIVHYSTEDGLSDNRIMCITKDREGFMWFGTWEGISRFDGHSFVTYKSQSGERSNFETNRIDAIVEDAHGYLWLKSFNNQLYRFDKKTEQFLFIPDLLKENQSGKINFRYIIATPQGPVWLMTHDQGIFCMQQNGNGQPTYEHFAAGIPGAYPLPSNDITLFHADSTGQIWIGTSKGLVLLEKRSSGKYESRALPSLPVSEQLKHVQSAGNDIWFAGENGQLVLYSRAQHQFSAYKISEQSLNGLYLPAHEQTIYCTTAGGELIRFNKTTHATQTFTSPDQTAFKSITGDKSGNIWIEPTGNGIIRFDPATHTFQPYTLQSDPYFINSFKGFTTFEDNKHRFWALMKGSGLGYYNPDKKAIDYFNNDPANPLRLFNNTVRIIYYDPQGVLWFATIEDGLHRVVFYENNFEQKQLTPEPGRMVNEVRGLITDHYNRLWLSSKAGKIVVLKDGVKQVIKLGNSPAGNLGMVYCMLEDRQNNIWLGTKDKGLYKAVPVNTSCTSYQLQHFQPGMGDSAISSDKIYAIQQMVREISGRALMKMG